MKNIANKMEKSKADLENKVANMQKKELRQMVLQSVEMESRLKSNFEKLNNKTLKKLEESIEELEEETIPEIAEEIAQH